MPINAGYGSTPLRGGGIGNTNRFRTQVLVPESQRRGQRAGERRDAYDQALDDPTGTADLFGDYFQRAAEGYAAPQQRVFQNTVASNAANVAGRFGGNASTIETGVIQSTADDFSRNLTEALARLAPQQVAAGQHYTDQLGGASENAGSEYDRSLQFLMDALHDQRKNEKDAKKGGILGAAGGILGGVAGSFLGPAGTAFGAKAATSII